MRRGCVLFGLSLAGWSATGWLLIHLKLGLATVAAILLALAVILLFLGGRYLAHRVAAAMEPPSLGEAADRLAWGLLGQWEEESAVRRIYDPYPLEVPWRSAPAHVIAPNWAMDLPDLAGRG